MDYIDFFKQTVEAVEEREYPFSHSVEDQNAALYFSDKEVKRLVAKPEKIVPFSMGGRTVFTIENTDSFEAARSMYERWPQSIFSDFKMPLVLNFANPHTPGGGRSLQAFNALWVPDLSRSIWVLLREQGEQRQRFHRCGHP